MYSIAQIGNASFLCAIVDARTAVMMDPTNSKALHTLSRAYYSAGNYQKAEEAAMQGLNIDPDNQVPFQLSVHLFSSHSFD
jgi:Flp pilus assembly protein TadD